ncbi:MAG: hypothetical protein ABW032_01390 [Burkholderiaceae bacterium]
MPPLENLKGTLVRYFSQALRTRSEEGDENEPGMFDLDRIRQIHPNVDAVISEVIAEVAAMHQEDESEFRKYFKNLGGA